METVYLQLQNYRFRPTRQTTRQTTTGIQFLKVPDPKRRHLYTMSKVDVEG